MGTIIRGDELAATLKQQLQGDLSSLYSQGYRKAKLSVILVGNYAPSLSYVKSKTKLMEDLGVIFDLHHLDETVDEKTVLEIIDTLNNDPEVDGVFVQMPLPKHINSSTVVSRIDYKKDVDGLHPMNLGKLLINEPQMVACTPQGVMALLDQTHVDLTGKKAIVLGRSILVGKPVAQLLEQRNATVTIAHSKTQNLEALCKEQDIIIAAIGRPKMINSNYVKEGSIIIDVGINRVDGKIVGDVDFDDVIDLVSFITPVPKGVGPMTVAMLASNTVKAYKENMRNQ